MERLTRRKEDGHAYVVGCPDFEIPKIIGLIIQRVVDRLAAYEDTDLEPEAIEALKLVIKGKAVAKIKEFYGIPIDRLIELAQADQEGRCVVLPCKRDATLWTFRTYPNRAVYKFKVTDLSTLNGRTMLNTDIMGVIDARDIGKTVFLTREQAEDALRREQDDN